jgi:hypothetical protein
LFALVCSGGGTLIGLVGVGYDANWARSYPTPLPAVKTIGVRDDKLVASSALEHGSGVTIPTTRPFVSLPISKEEKKGPRRTHKTIIIV